MRIERRRLTRRSPHRDEPLTHMRMRTGPGLEVVNVANRGALVEGDVRLLPGTHLDVHVVTRDGRVLVRSRVVRAFVFDVQAASIRYRAALSFDLEVNTAPPGYSFPSGDRQEGAERGTNYPAAIQPDPAAAEERWFA